MAAGRILPRSAWQRRSFAASDCADCIKWPFPLRTAVRRGNRDSRSCVFLLRGSRHAVRRSVLDLNTTATRRRPRGGPGKLLRRRGVRHFTSQRRPDHRRAHRVNHPARAWITLWTAYGQVTKPSAGRGQPYDGERYLLFLFGGGQGWRLTGPVCVSLSWAILRVIRRPCRSCALGAVSCGCVPG